MPGRSTRRGRPVRVKLVSLLAVAIAALGLVVYAPPAQAATPTPLQISQTVFNAMTIERRANHLPAYTWNGRLVSSAHAHNLAMARANTLSHQVAGEVGLGTRITRTGYTWSTAGENIGVNSALTLAGALTLQSMMYNERAPYDGHRRNILSSSFVSVSIDIYIDTARHRLWLTEDFGRPR